MNKPFPFVITSDGSVVDNQGKIVYFSLERFQEDIVKGPCCFICGAHPSQKVFNDEHVIPDWILRRCRLHDKTIILPNNKEYTYSRYKVRCCRECNTELGHAIEAPISDLFKDGYKSFKQIYNKISPWLFFKWVCLLFLKTHLKDRNLPFHLDRRKGSELIGEYYDWSFLHHIHCVTRSHYTGAVIDNTVMGSVFVLQAKEGLGFGEFDFADLYAAQTLLFRIKDVAVCVVLNDAGGCCSLQPEFILKWVTGPLTPVQLREILARLAHLNRLIKERPIFHTDFDEKSYRIGVTTPKFVEIEKGEADQFGKIMYQACKPFLENTTSHNMTASDIKSNIQNGKWSFIIDEEGNFIT